MADINQIKCPACGAPLPYNAGAQELKCEHCGTSFKVEDIAALKDADDALGAPFDWGSYKEAAHEKLEGMRVFQCQSCGAEIEADQDTVASQCPYCGNNVVITDTVSNGLKPNAMIPFAIDKSQLYDIIQNFYKGKKLIPNNFFDKNEIGKIQGLYVPFWLYSATVGGQVSLDATKTRMYSQGQYNVTERHHFLLSRDGDMAFSDVPVDASTKIDDDLMDSIEPYDYSKMVDFNPAYLSGFVAEKFNIDPDVQKARAEQRMRATAMEAFRNSAAGYDSVNVRSARVGAKDLSLKYVFLPVYLLNCTYNGQNYRYAINGQTGKVVGELPISKEKSRAEFLKTFGIAAAVAAAIAFFL